MNSFPLVFPLPVLIPNLLYAYFMVTLHQLHANFTPTLNQLYSIFTPTLHQLYPYFTPTLNQLYTNHNAHHSGASVRFGWTYSAQDLNSLEDTILSLTLEVYSGKLLC